MPDDKNFMTGDALDDDPSLQADFEDDGDGLDPEVAELALPDGADIVLDHDDMPDPGAPFETREVGS